MKIVIFGGDGFCGWPTSLHLSDLGHEIIIVDNLSRRAIENELGATSLTPITSIDERLAAWTEVSGKTIRFENIDVAQDYDQLNRFLATERPDALVHFAEQRSAPYSMIDSAHKRYTVDNNINATNNILASIVENNLDTHIVHLGTMGVYGYGTAGMTIPEGYLTVTVDTPEGPIQQEIVYPPNPGSIYHMTKVLDHQIFAYYAKNDELRITDLHQGIIWGTNTDQCNRDERLINRFDYDGEYGTVLNRFLIEAALGYPLTVHGTGGQTRAFIHIQDMAVCIQLAVENPPSKSERVKVFNQMTETHRVRDLAALVSKLTGAEVQNVPNPRKESAENDLVVANDNLLALGLKPTTLSEGLLQEIEETAAKYTERVDRSKIPARALWTRHQHPGEPTL
ncbi:MAG: NAD-dependent epimerase/dehydratase family protein [Corynebacterium sp.]|nr:NAD-dependent epimerase/dehydratase family protein [Corynebacterium sp.]